MKLSKVTIGDEGSSEGENLQGSPSASKVVLQCLLKSI